MTLRRERVRVVPFVTNFFVGGTERQVVNLVHGIDPLRFDVTMACFQKTGPLLAEAERTGAPVREYRIGRLYGPRALRSLLRLAADLRRARVQVVHAFGFYPNVFAVPAARLAGVPVILASIRDTGDHLTPRQKAVQRMACALAHRVVANSEAVRAQLVAEGYDTRRIVVLRNGVDLSAVVGGATGTRVRAELGMRDDVPAIGVISRLNRLKGVEYFLDAAERLAPRFPEAVFLVAGDNTEPNDRGRYRAGLEAEARRRGLGDRVRFLGFRRDVPEVLAALTVSVLPSLTEGLSNSVLESMAVGVPVVATAVGGNLELVEDGVSGVLVPPRDGAALASAIASLLERPAHAAAMAATGRRRTLEAFSLERMVDDTAALYVSLLERAARRGVRRAWSPA